MQLCVAQFSAAASGFKTFTELRLAVKDVARLSAHANQFLAASSLPVAAFDFVFKVAAPGSSGMLQVVSGGGCEDYTIDLSGPVSVDATGGWSTYVSQSR